MKVDEEVLEDLIVQNIKRMHRKGKNKDKAETRARITFGSIYERDLVMSFASNLPKDASVEVVIPDHLISLKRYLDNFAFKIRSHARENNLGKVSTSVRLEDSEQTLVLAVRQPDSAWKSYTREDLRSLDANLKQKAKTSKAKEKTPSTASSCTDSDQDFEETITPSREPPSSSKS